jgi:hypothetical protein
MVMPPILMSRRALEVFTILVLVLGLVFAFITVIGHCLTDDGNDQEEDTVTCPRDHLNKIRDKTFDLKSVSPVYGKERE